MKKIINILLLTVIAGLFVTAAAIGQSTNIVVTNQAAPTPATVHQILIPAGSPAIAQIASFLNEIDPQKGQVTAGQVPKTVTVYPNNDGTGSYGATIIYQ